MYSRLAKFIYAEQVKNNFSLYKNDSGISFELDIPSEYKPISQRWFNLSYFLIPQNEGKLKYNVESKEFFDKNIFFKINDSIYYPFFLHPTSVTIFKTWIGSKYEYVKAENSVFEATPTSSYRSLLVRNKITDEYFIAKVSIFGNVANGARQIDWTSAEGQFFFSNCTEKAAKRISDFSILKDEAAFGLTGDFPIHFSKKYNITYGPDKIQTFGNVIRRVDTIFNDDSETAIYSIAAITSTLDKNDCYFQKIYETSGKTFEDFFIYDFVLVIFEKFFELFNNHGISLESHCQNTLIEVTKDWNFTGRVVYRDFDITCFDRARYPFFYPTEWREYAENRLDRTSLFSNLSAREELGKNFFAQLFGSLVEACLLCATKLNIISKNNTQKIHDKIYSIFIERLHCVIPINKKILLEKNEWPYWKNVYSDIDISEIPTKLIKINSFDKNIYDEFLINSPELKISDFYKTENEEFVLGFSKNIYTKLFAKKRS